MELAIEAKGITKKFGSKVAVNGIDLKVETGSIYAVLGPNGAGKTTLLRMLATQCRMDGGSARIFGADVSSDPMAVRRMIGMTGQFATIDAELTAMENLEIAGRLSGMSKADALARADELLAQFSLSEARDLELSAFSGGMRRRLDLAASLMVRPRLIILDEPTTGLDPITRQELWGVIRNLVANGSTVLLTTQYLEEADQLADRIAVIQNGSLVAEGTPDQLKQLTGKARLEVTLQSKGELQAAIQVARENSGTALTPLEGRYGFSMSAEDAAQQIALLSSIAKAGLNVESFQVVKPTLDDVFVKLVQENENSKPSANAISNAQNN
jgi:ABC-2 type transport system ATP-binding protein